MAKILLADDDPLIIRMYQTALVYQGFEVDSAQNGTEALEKLKNGNYDIFVFDVMMPQMDGLELLKNLKKIPRYKDVPKIALTNLAGAEDVEEGIKLGVNKYIIKSHYKPKEIVDLIKNLLSQKKK
jgi:CheY-like chemotaxis protein